MAFGKIEVDTSVIESKIRLLHKHLGNYIDDLNKICNECGSTDTVIDKTIGDRETQHKVKKCGRCDTVEFLETELKP